ncbi:MAG: DUF2905 domain-containing protein [Chlamydiales bacterium]|nr:DUF2905 domain-containing protein [Chlamydiia bacterium]MCP5506936.1 DUF2905 domain-containing protein [Chlamydiales bacterium]
MPIVGKILIALGVVLITIGVFFYFRISIPYLGRLPGDIFIQGDNYTIYFPITTSLLISLLIYFVLKLF